MTKKKRSARALPKRCRSSRLVDGVQFEIVCVNDGSRDRTLERLLAIAAADSRVRVVDLTRRFGKEAALTAGLDEAAAAPR